MIRTLVKSDVVSTLTDSFILEATSCQGIWPATKEKPFQAAEISAPTEALPVYLNYTLSTCGAWRKQTSSSGTSIICKAVKTLPCLVCQHVEERYEASNEKMAPCPSAGPAVSQKESIQCIHYIRRDTALQTKKSCSSVRNFQQGPYADIYQ